MVSQEYIAGRRGVLRFIKFKPRLNPRLTPTDTLALSAQPPTLQSLIVAKDEIVVDWSRIRAIYDMRSGRGRRKGDRGRKVEVNI